MDINSLLSPRDSPAASPSPGTASPGPRQLPLAHSASPSTKSPLANTLSPPPTSQPAEPPPTFQRPALPTRRSLPHNNLAASAKRAPTSVAARPAKPPVARHASTSGMDTLADLAAMQHHQHATRAAASGLRSSSVVEQNEGAAAANTTSGAASAGAGASPAPPPHPTPIRPSLQAISRAHSGSRSSIDIAMAEAPTQGPPPRVFTSTALPQADLAAITEMASYLARRPNSYAAHVRLIELLHAGLLAHAADDTRDARRYDLLADLQQALEAMASRYALGEDLWMRRLEMLRLLAAGLEDCLALVETLEKAVVEEAGSARIWHFYGDFMAALHDAAVGAGQADYTPLAERPLGRIVSLSDEDLAVAAEVFGREQLVGVWKRAADATKHNIPDSRLAWDRYTALILQDIGTAPSRDAVAAVQAHFLERLQTPHAGFDATFQQFSTFVSQHQDDVAWEQTMVATNRATADAKERFAQREPHERRWAAAVAAGDRTAEWAACAAYLEWEQGHNRKKKVFSYAMLATLFQRVLLRFPAAAETWEELLLFLGDDAEPHPGGARPSLLPALSRACAHCPGSGALWAAYIQGAEREDLPFPDIGQIKHKATSTGLLDGGAGPDDDDGGRGAGAGGGANRGSIENALAVHAAWCGFLRRRAFRRDATDEERDVAEVGLRSALEDAETLGRQAHQQQQQEEEEAGGGGGAGSGSGPYRGDPQYRLERTYIKFLDQSRNVGAARDAWKGLVARHGDGYEFWLRYYEWEMRTWARLEGAAPASTGAAAASSGGLPPRDATGVLQQAARRQTLDWPEKILETYLRHCEDHEDVATLQTAARLVRKRAKEVAKRREKEAARAAEEAAAAFQAQQLQLQQQQQQQQQRQTQLQQQHEAQQADGDGELAEEKKAKPAKGKGKRKRDEATNGDGAADQAPKRSKASPSDEDGVAASTAAAAAASPQSSTKAPEPARDREHTSVLVTNLPWDATEARVRHFFRDCGSVKSVVVAVAPGSAAATATIEFGDRRDVPTARTRDLKLFDGREIRVEVGAGSIVYVANFPPSADEEWLRDLFGKHGEILDVRFPSTKFNAKRRFCYIQFRSYDQARAAEAALDGHGVDGGLKLVAKLSDPDHKGKRKGAIYEGREVYVSNVDWAAGEEELKEVFGKYGEVERVRVPRNKDGKSKGMAFVVFEDKAHAEAAIELDKTKFKSRLLHVEMATTNPHKKG